MSTIIFGTVVEMKQMSAKGTGWRGRSTWSVEVDVIDNSQGDEEVPKHRYQVEGQEQSKEYRSQFRIL
jgi:hypothetical protein